MSNALSPASRRTAAPILALVAAAATMAGGLTAASVASAVPTVPSPTPSDRLAARDGEALVVASDGTVRSWNGDPFQAPVVVSGLSDVIAVSAGGGHYLALTSDGEVWAWGVNSSGQLGDGTTTGRTTPVQVDDTNLSDVAAISAGENHSLAIDSSGVAWAWGENSSGQVGDGTTTDRTSPVQVDDTNLGDVTVVSGGGAHSLAIDSNGAAWAWGDNFWGQLGDGTTTDRTTPVQVDDTNFDYNISAISAGGAHSLATDERQNVWAWGDNFWGQLGDGTFDNSSAPVQAATGMGPDWTLVAAGYDHSVASREEGDTHNWGFVVNGWCCLADPIAVSGLPEDTIAITASPTGWVGPHLAVQGDGTVWFWGDGYFSAEPAPDFDW